MLMNNALGVNYLLATQKVKCKPIAVITKNCPVHIFVQIEGEGTESQPYVGVLYCSVGASDSNSLPGHWGIFNPADQQDSIITGGSEAEIEAGTHGGLLYTIDITVHGYAWTEGTYSAGNVKNYIVNDVNVAGNVSSHVGGDLTHSDNELGVILSNEETPSKCEFYIY